MCISPINKKSIISLPIDWNGAWMRERFVREIHNNKPERSCRCEIYRHDCSVQLAGVHRTWPVFQYRLRLVHSSSSSSSSHDGSLSATESKYCSNRGRRYTRQVDAQVFCTHRNRRRLAAFFNAIVTIQQYIPTAAFRCRFGVGLVEKRWQCSERDLFLWSKIFVCVIFTKKLFLLIDNIEEDFKFVQIGLCVTLQFLLPLCIDFAIIENQSDFFLALAVRTTALGIFFLYFCAYTTPLSTTNF